MKKNYNSDQSGRLRAGLLSTGLSWFVFLALFAGMATLQTSCDNILGSDEDAIPEISGVRYLHPDTAAVKGTPEKVGPGEMFVIEGKNLHKTERAYFNGVQATFNPALVTSSHMIIRIPGDMPFGEMDPDDEVMNTIRLVSKGGETVYQFPILPPIPEITRVSKEFAEAGETVRLEGNFLYMVDQVTFPGGITTTDFEFPSDGTWLDVVVPDGVNEPGHINVTTTSGTSDETYQTMFNDSTGIFINFNDKNPWNPWGTPGDDTPYVGDDIPGIEPLNGNYLHWLYDDPLTPGMWWFQSLATQFLKDLDMELPDFPDDTPTSELVLRFEVNTPHDKFKSGYIQFSFDWWIEKDWNPFIVGGERKPLVTDGWETFTIGLDNFDRGAQATYGPMKNAGEFLLRYVNPGEPDGVAFEEVNIAFDNLRIIRKF